MEHWQQQPREAGKFGALGESSSHPKPISFKLPESLYQQLEAIAASQNRSVNLLIKEFVLENIDEILDVTE